MKSTEFDKQKDKKLNNPRYTLVKPKSSAKSKHRHEYIEVLFLLLREHPLYSNQVEERAYRTTICVHCGKVKGLNVMEEMKKNGGRFYISLSREEMLERYPLHLCFNLGDYVYKKYYDLDGQDYIDIRTMYENQVRTFFNGQYEITGEDITHGLKNNIKPKEMAILIIQKTINSNKGDNTNA